MLINQEFERVKNKQVQRRFDVFMKTFLSRHNLTSNFFIGILMLLVLLGSRLVESVTVVNLVITVPYEKPYIFRKEMIQPAVDYALSSLKNRRLNQEKDFEFQVVYQ